MKKKVWLPIVILAALLILAGIGVYTLLYRPAEDIYAAAMTKSETAPFAEAQESLSAAIRDLEGNPFAKKRVAELTERMDELLSAEADRERAQALQDAYAAADALEQAGQDEEALAAFQALKDYEDAPQRAQALQARIQRQRDLEAAKAVFTGENFDEAIAALTALDTAEAQAAAEALQQQKAVWIETSRRQYAAAAAGRLSAGAWHTAAIGASPWIAGDGRYADPPAQAEQVFSGLASIFYLSGGKVLTTGETFGEEATIAGLTDVKKVAPGLVHALFLQSDGRVTAVGSKGLDRLPQEAWTGMIDVAAGAWHSVGLRSDGILVACGTNDHGQCDVSEWADVAAISAGLWHTVGLRQDGTVVACGDNTYGQCDVDGWQDIVAVSCGACTTVGLTKDGAVVACGDNGAGQCDVAGWTDVAVIAAGAYHTVGLRLDGTLVSAGLVPAELPKEPLFPSNWPTQSVAAPGSDQKAATVYIQGEGDSLGPWLYMDTKGIVTICIDYSEARELFRADMLATKDALPSGRVTRPSASGEIIFMPTELPEIQARTHNAVLAFTGDYIGFTRNAKGIMIRNGVVYYDRAETSSVAIRPDGTLQLIRPGETRASRLLAEGVRDSFSFGPLLVEDGKRVYNRYDDKVYTMRVVLGYSDPYHFLAAVAMRDRLVQMTHMMMADVCVRYGCRLAYNLDGGHSTSLVFMGKELSMLTLRNTPHSNIRGLSDIIQFLEIDQSILDARERAKQENSENIETSETSENSETSEEMPPMDGGNG